MCSWVCVFPAGFGSNFRIIVGFASGPGSRLHLRHFSGLYVFGSHFQIKYGSGSVLCSTFTGLSPVRVRCSPCCSQAIQMILNADEMLQVILNLQAEQRAYVIDCNRVTSACFRCDQ